MSRTILEQRLESAGTPEALVHQRRRHFSVEYGVWLKQEDMRLNGVHPTGSDIPEESWIKQNFISMVRDEGVRAFDSASFKDPPTERYVVSDAAMHDYLERCEELVFGLTTERIIRNENLDPSAKIQKILSDPELGNSANNKNVSADTIKEFCALNANEQAPLMFVLPAFPFKEQNEYRSYLPANTPDFGEVALICRMHALAMSVNQIYHNDVRWLIVTDGTAYETIFGAPSGCSREYIGHLRTLRNALNLQSTIHFVDLADLVARYNIWATTNKITTFDQLVAAVKRYLVNQRDADVLESLNNLAEGMKWNRCWAHIRAENRREVLWRTLITPMQELQTMSELLGREVYDRSVETAISYASFNLAMRRTDLIRHYFPLGVRATSHPKKDQVAIPRVGAVSPWNGVSVATLDKAGRPEFASVPLYQLRDGDHLNIIRAGGIPSGIASRAFAEKYKL